VRREDRAGITAAAIRKAASHAPEVRAMPIPNSDSVPREFFPGISSGAASTGAPGRPGASGAAADNADAGPVTPPTGAWQPGARFPASTSGTVMPDQDVTSVIEPGPASGYTGTGAGHGSPSHFPRRPWQQSDGGA
jgi:hypothetical protein